MNNKKTRAYKSGMEKELRRIEEKLFRSNMEPRQCIMSAKDLAGMWIKSNRYDINFNLVVGIRDGFCCFMSGYSEPPSEDWFYTSTPHNDASWRSVVIN